MGNLEVAYLWNSVSDKNPKLELGVGSGQNNGNWYSRNLFEQSISVIFSFSSKEWGIILFWKYKTTESIILL